MVVEGVGGAIEDPHHQRAVAEVEGPLPEREGRHRHGADATAAEFGRFARRSEETRGECLAVVARARVVGTERLEQVEELLARSRCRRGPARADRRAARTRPRRRRGPPATRDGPRPAAADLGGLGDAAEQRHRLVGSPRFAISIAASAAIAPGWSGWSSSAWRSTVLVARRDALGDQPVDLARARAGRRRPRPPPRGARR